MYLFKDEPNDFQDKYKEELEKIKMDINDLEEAAVLDDLTELLLRQAAEFVDTLEQQNIESEELKQCR